MQTIGYVIAGIFMRRFVISRDMNSFITPYGHFLNVFSYTPPLPFPLSRVRACVCSLQSNHHRTDELPGKVIIKHFPQTALQDGKHLPNLPAQIWKLYLEVNCTDEEERLKLACMCLCVSLSLSLSLSLLSLIHI